MAGTGEKFGAFIRRKREVKEIGLREMAKMIGVSPTYMSKVERDEFPPRQKTRCGPSLTSSGATSTSFWR
jgi:ribosome-binding protein aMBF1 (putative translation factor)